MLQLLMDCDLFSPTGSAQCHQIIQKICAIFDQFKQENGINMWIMYWDKQLFKLFAFQYKQCISKIQKYLTTIHCAVYIGKTIKFRPSLKEMKRKIKAQTNKWIQTPNQFKGFDTIQYKNILKNKEIKQMIGDVEHKINAMMRALTDAVKEYEEQWIEFGNTQCTFTLLQDKAKQMEQIPDEKR
eukprot:176667_1